MSVSSGKSRFIPFRKKEIIELILRDIDAVSSVAVEPFNQFCEMIESILHFEFRKELEILKDVYYPINPDQRGLIKPSKEEIDKSNESLLNTLRKVLNDANYDAISKAEIEEAYANSALVGISVNIDLRDYEFIEIYARGHRTDSFIQKKWLYSL